MTVRSKLKILLIMVAIMLASAIILFCTSNLFAGSADALIEGLSGNRFVITGLVGNRPQHYFVNDNGESTLQNTKVEDTGQSHYAIVPITQKAGVYSGWGELALTSDIRELSKKGVQISSKDYYVCLWEKQERNEIFYEKNCFSSRC